jgi:hypothetical protein
MNQSMIPLEGKRPERDVDIRFDLSGRNDSGGGLGHDPRNELNMSVHRPSPSRPTRKMHRSPVQKRDLGIRFVYDRSIYPAAFVVDHVRQGSVASNVAQNSCHSFGLGSRLIGLNNQNIVILSEHEAGKLLQDTVARATFSSGTVVMRFDNIELSQDLSANGNNLNLWGKVALSQVTQKYIDVPESEKKRERKKKKNKKKEEKWDVILHGLKPSKHKPRNQTRYGSVPCVGGNFTKEQRYKDLEKVHTGTQANTSSFGFNPLSTQRTSPGFSIGLSTREDWKKVGFEGVQKVNSTGSSGQFSCLGRRNISFGVSERQLPPFKGIDPGFDSPGPAGYPEKYGMGPNSLSVASSATFGVSKRKGVATNRGLDSPGPIYDPKDLDAIGKPTRRSASFGVGPAHCPPGLNLSPFKNYDEVDLLLDGSENEIEDIIKKKKSSGIRRK